MPMLLLRDDDSFDSIFTRLMGRAMAPSGISDLRDGTECTLDLIQI